MTEKADVPTTPQGLFGTLMPELFDLILDYLAYPDLVAMTGTCTTFAARIGVPGEPGSYFGTSLEGKVRFTVNGHQFDPSADRFTVTDEMLMKWHLPTPCRSTGEYIKSIAYVTPCATGGKKVPLTNSVGYIHADDRESFELHGNIAMVRRIMVCATIPKHGLHDWVLSYTITMPTADGNQLNTRVPLTKDGVQAELAHWAADFAPKFYRDAELAAAS